VLPIWTAKKPRARWDLIATARGKREPIPSWEDYHSIYWTHDHLPGRYVSIDIYEEGIYPESWTIRLFNWPKRVRLKCSIGKRYEYDLEQ